MAERPPPRATVKLDMGEHTMIEDVPAGMTASEYYWDVVGMLTLDLCNHYEMYDNRPNRLMAKWLKNVKRARTRYMELAFENEAAGY